MRALVGHGRPFQDIALGARRQVVTRHLPAWLFWRSGDGSSLTFCSTSRVGIAEGPQGRRVTAAGALPRATRNFQEQRRRQQQSGDGSSKASPRPPRPEVSPQRNKNRRGKQRLHSTDLEDLGPGPSKEGPSAEGDAPREQVLLPRSPQIMNLIRRPVAELPRKPTFFVKFGPPMTADDLTADAPSIFVESRKIIDDVLERRKSTQSAPDHIAPDTPFWRVPVKLRKRKAVEWQDIAKEDDGGSAAEGAEAARSETEAAEQLKGIVDIHAPVKNWKTAVLAPSRLAPGILKADDDGKDTEDTEGHSVSGSGSSSSPGDRAKRVSNPAGNLVSALRQRAEEFASTGVDPNIKDSLEAALKHSPGSERAARLREMQGCAKTFETLITEGTASVENFNMLIRAQGLQGKMDEAMKTHDAMQVHGFDPNADTFVSLLAGAAHKCDAELARRLFLKMREQLVSATPRVYATLMRAHVRAGDLASGFALLRKMEDERLQPDVVVHTVLIDGLVKEDKLEKAWEQFHSIRTWKLIAPDEVLFTVMIKACAKACEPERALNILDDLRTSGLYPTDLTYGEVIHALSTTPDHARKCFDFFRQMQAEDMPISSFVWGKLLQACRFLGDIPRAREVVKDMQKHGVQLRPSMYCDLVGLFASAMRQNKLTDNERMQNLKSAWHVVAEVKKRCHPESIDWVRLLNVTMEVYIAAKLEYFAVEMLQQYSIFGVQPDATTYQQLCELLGRDLKDVGRFFALWDVIPKDPKPADAVYHLALEVALLSKSARRTCVVLEEMYAAQVYPTPELTERLAVAGRSVIQIHMVVGKFIALNRDTKAAEARRESELLQTHMSERDFELAAVGAHVRTPTPEQEARAAHFKSLRKRGHYQKPWLPKGEYIMLKKKGGEAYARKHDKARPNLLAA